MSLNAKQAKFTECISKLIVWAFENELPVILSEAYRTPEQAALNAEKGSGIKNSVHTKKLAVDMFRYKDGTISWNGEDYTALGEKWKSMHEDARHGGDFAKPDHVHFSFRHKGVM